MKITKADIERMCCAAGMKPAARGNVSGVEVFVADGVSKYPHHHYKRFGLSPIAYPGDTNVTLWFSGKGEEGFSDGCFMFSAGIPRFKRIKDAIDDVTSFLNTKKRQVSG